MSLCDRAGAFVDGMLDDDQAAEFRLHLADCEACQAEVEAALALSVLADQAGVGAMALKSGTPTKSWRWFYFVIGPALAAAALLVWIGIRDTGDRDAGPELAARFNASLSPTRSVEVRFSYGGADHHRPYDVPRADRAPVETIGADVIGDLERSGDTSGLAAAYTLIGASQRAEMALESAPESAATLSDRAALAIIEQDYWDAIRFAAAALENDPDHVPAIWNRAIALSHLGLDLTAAKAFEQVAESAEPGWAEEAKERAARLRGAYEELKKHWEIARKAYDRLIKELEPPSEDVIRAYPDSVRLALFNAACIAKSATDLSRLAPVAKALDRRFGGHILERYIERLIGASWQERAKLAARYERVWTSKGAASDRSLAGDAVRAGQRDIALASLFWVPRLDDDQRALYLELATAMQDPWLEFLAHERVLRSHVILGRGLDAAEEGAEAVRRCDAAGLEFRCLRMEFWLASALSQGARPGPAQKYARRGWARTRRIGDWVMQVRYLWLFARFAAENGHISGDDLPLMRAYLSEALKRWPTCASQTYAATNIARELSREGSLAEAERVLEQLDSHCPDSPPLFARFEIEAYLVRGNSSRAERLLAQLVPFSEKENRAEAAFIAGLAESTTNPSRALKHLRQAIEASAESAGSFGGDSVWAKSHTLAAMISGRDGDFGAAVEWLAREIGVEERRCTLAIAGDTQVLVAALDGSGTPAGLLIDESPRDHLDGKLVPQPLVEHLRKCSTVDVIARPPFVGRPVLPPDLAWRFRERGASRDHPPTSMRHLVISDTTQPEAMGLARLASPPIDDVDVHLRGPAATPGRVLDELETATIVEIHTHGVTSADGHGGAALIVSPDKRGNLMLSASDIAKTTMKGAPLVLLAACRGALTPKHPGRGQSLASAFLRAGARTVIASPEPIGDRDGYKFFSAVRKRIAGGQPAVEAIRGERLKKPDDHWSKQVVVFE